jgi:hypothetical protein
VAGCVPYIWGIPGRCALSVPRALCFHVNWIIVITLSASPVGKHISLGTSEMEIWQICKSAWKHNTRTARAIPHDTTQKISEILTSGMNATFDGQSCVILYYWSNEIF